MNKKTWNIISSVTAWGLVLFILAVLLGAVYIFIGNPASWFIAKIAARSYVEESFPNENYEMTDFGFDFIGPYYYADFKHNEKPDNYFSVYVNYWGKVRHSTYDNIKEGWNTAYRLTDEYNTLLLDSYISEELSFDTLSKSCDLALVYDEVRIKGQIERAMLIPNKEYDTRELGQRQGIIYMDIGDEEVSVRRMGEILSELKEYLYKKNCPFNLISITLKSTDEKNFDELKIDKFPRDLIDSENMENEMKEYFIGQGE